MGREQLSIEQLGDRWERLVYEFGIDTLLITEHFEVNKSFVVSRLSMELEDQYVICYDHGNKLIAEYSVLTMFLQHSLKTIYLFPYKDWYMERLEFEDGYVLIEKVS